MAANRDGEALSAEKRELRSGSPPWHMETASFRRTRLDADTRCDLAIVGAGITGSLAAEAASRAGLSVMVIDRFMPGRGSTAASTAMLQWEIDAPLNTLAELYGFEKAAGIYRRSLAAVSDLAAFIGALQLDCAFRPRGTLYLGGGDSGYVALAEEHALRRRAGLPGSLLDRGRLADAFEMDRPAALHSPGSAEADPLRLALGVLRLALERGARLVEDEVTAYDWDSRRAVLTLAGGRQVEAAQVVLATGYTMPPFVTSDLHRTVSSWCFATKPQPEARFWRERALIWEAAHPYLYARTTAEGRFLAGGEDEEMGSVRERERAMPEKIERLVGKMRALWPRGDYAVDTVWCAEFGETGDGLPLIGPVPGAPRFFAAYGYGGNGITFSYMASRMLTAWLAGETRPWFQDFALDRDGPAHGRMASA